MDERRRNDTHIGDSICISEGFCDPQNMTNLASIGTRSTATPTTNSMTDESSSQQLRSIKGKYWLELAPYPADHHADPRLESQLPARTLIAVLEHLRDRIQYISLDINSLNKSCSVEAAIDFALPSPSRRSEKRA